MTERGVQGPSRRMVVLGALGGGSLGMALGQSVLGRSEPPSGGTKTLPVGMNLAGIADWSRGFPFLNLMWGARIWATNNANIEGPWNTEMTRFLELDDDGYPLEVPFRPPAAQDDQHVFTVLPNRVKAGRYVMLYDGEGDIATAGMTKIIDAKPGRIEISMEHGGSDDHLETITISRSVRGNHIRNIRIVPIEHEKTDLDANPFRSDILEFCKPWHCLRFMDWMSTNYAIDRRWADRKKRSFYTQIGVGAGVDGLPEGEQWKQKWSSGIAIELCIQLANMTRTNAWLCVPHLADDEYIAEMARLVKETLDPSLKVYLEFSNEVWNWSFAQAQWALRSELAGDLVTAVGDPPPWAGRVKPSSFKDGVVVEGAGEGADHVVRLAALMRRCFKIWEDVFTGTDRKRLVRVCGVQGDWIENSTISLDWVMKHGGCDALSPGGYFGPDDDLYKVWDAKGAALTVSDVISDMRRVIVNNQKFVRSFAQLARRYRLQLIVYEGGQHLQPEGQAEKPYNPALAKVQKHPEMYDLYRQHLDVYANARCNLFCAFSSVTIQGSRYGSWGHVEHYGQDPADMPKYRAILEANSAPTKG